MGTFPQGRTPRSAAGLLLALVAGALAAPAEARAASCGRYVVFGSGDERATPAHPPGDHKPCHGPTCSSAPSPLPPAPAPTPPTPGEEWGHLSARSADPGTGRVGPVPDLPVPPAARRSASVYRPPR